MTKTDFYPRCQIHLLFGTFEFWSFGIVSGFKLDIFVKSPKTCHACESRHPEPPEITGFPPSREWLKRLIFDFLRDRQASCFRFELHKPGILNSEVALKIQVFHNNQW